MSLAPYLEDFYSPFCSHRVIITIFQSIKLSNMAGLVVDEASLVLGVIISTLVVGAFFVFIRTITRTIVLPLFGWDDALIINTWVCDLECSCESCSANLS